MAKHMLSIMRFGKLCIFLGYLCFIVVWVTRPLHVVYYSAYRLKEGNNCDI